MNTRTLGELVVGAVVSTWATCQSPAATWTEITAPSSPAFAHHDMTYDSARGRLVLAGRTSIMSSVFGMFAGAPDGTWTPLPVPSPALPGRQDVELAYDSHRDVVVLYTTSTNRVWEFNGTEWNVITAAHAPVQCADGASLQYDPVRRRTVLVGSAGFPGVTNPSETWLWDGTDWTLAAGPDQSPHGAAGGSMTFDAARGEMVLLTMGNMETWTFDGSRWSPRTPVTKPSPGLWVFDLAYDPVRRLAVFFCGETTSPPAAYPRETWAWDGTDWRKLEIPSAPPETIDYALAYFPERNALVLHGGWGSPDWDFRNQVWQLAIGDAPPAGIRFTDIRAHDGQVDLTTVGRIREGAPQILQATTAAGSASVWVNLRTNAAPALTNAWTTPLDAPTRLYRLQELL